MWMERRTTRQPPALLKASANCWGRRHRRAWGRRRRQWTRRIHQSLHSVNATEVLMASPGSIDVKRQLCGRAHRRARDRRRGSNCGADSEAHSAALYRPHARSCLFLDHRPAVETGFGVRTGLPCQWMPSRGSFPPVVPRFGGKKFSSPFWRSGGWRS